MPHNTPHSHTCRFLWGIAFSLSLSLLSDLWVSLSLPRGFWHFKGRFQITLGEFLHLKGWWFILTSVSRCGWEKNAPWFSGRDGYGGFCILGAYQGFCLQGILPCPYSQHLHCYNRCPTGPQTQLSSVCFLWISTYLPSEGRWAEESKQKGNGNCLGSGSFLVGEKKKMCADNGSPPQDCCVFELR